MEFCCKVRSLSQGICIFNFEIMNKILLIILFTSFHLSVFSQGEIGNNKSTVKYNLHRYIRKNNFKNTRIEQTASEIILAVNDSLFQPVKFSYHFDEYNRCDSKIISNCSECFKKFLNEMLGYKKFGWIQINDKLYVSKFSKQLMIIIGDDIVAGPGIEVKRVYWNKDEYNTMLSELK